jgi:hypothetical protein
MVPVMMMMPYATRAQRRRRGVEGGGEIVAVTRLRS